MFANEGYHLVLREYPQPCVDPPPPPTRMARWPKTPGELERCVGAGSVRTIIKERLFCMCVVCTAGAFIGYAHNVKSE